jgi:CBS domain-containing protein
MLVKDLMITDVRSIEMETPISEIVQAMADSHVSGLPVLDRGGRVLGVVSTTDVLQRQAEQSDVHAQAVMLTHTTAEELMTPTPHVIAPDISVQDAAKTMLTAGVHRLFVVEGGRLVGVISQTDIAHAVGTGRI